VKLIRAKDATRDGRASDTKSRANGHLRPSARALPWRFIVVALVVLGIGAILAQRYVGGLGTSDLQAEGTLEAREVTISSEVTARIVNLPFREGQTVHTGDVLVRLDDSVLQVQYREAEVTQRLVLGAELNRYVIHAPRDGVILRRDVEPGEVAVVGQPLLILADLWTLDLTLYVPQRDLWRVHPGQRIVLAPEAETDQTFVGVVQSISDKAEFTPRSTQTAEDRLNLVFAVKVNVDNPAGQLKPGMTVQARFGQ
jgi:multidrug resistance efflux pump